MAVSNASGRDVEYDVKPSDPGLGTPIALSAALTLGGTTFAALGCLTDIGGESLTLIGLFLLVAALVADVYAYSRTRTSGPVAISAGTGGKKPLPAGQTLPQSFPAGTWVEFYDHQSPHGVLAVSQPIFDSSAIVTFRECVDPSSLPDETQALLARAPGYHVEVT